MAKFIIEILQELDKDASKASTFVNNKALTTALDFAFDTRKKFILPEGTPPFKPDAAPLGMSPGNLQMETQRFYVFARPDLLPTRREALFIQLLEGIHPTEAELVLAIKEQNLTALYPNLTYDVLKAAGLVTVPEEFAAVAESKSDEKRGRGRPPGARNKPKEESGEVAS